MCYVLDYQLLSSERRFKIPHSRLNGFKNSFIPISLKKCNLNLNQQMKKGWDRHGNQQCFIFTYLLMIEHFLVLASLYFFLKSFYLFKISVCFSLSLSVGLFYCMFQLLCSQIYFLFPAAVLHSLLYMWYVFPYGCSIG